MSTDLCCFHPSQLCLTPVGQWNAVANLKDSPSLPTSTGNSHKAPAHSLQHMLLLQNNTWDLYTDGTSSQMGDLHRWDLFTDGTSSQMGPLYRWEIFKMGDLHRWDLFTDGTSSQMGPLHRWEIFTDGTSSQMGPLTDGTSTQMGPLHRWEIFTDGTSSQMGPLHRWDLMIIHTRTYKRMYECFQIE